MKKFGIYATTALGATAVSMAFFGAGVASADDYAGQTYGDASSAIADAGKKAVIASRAGDTLSDDKCVVTHSQSGIMGHHMARILKERGHLSLLKGLLTLEGSCSLPNSGLTAADFDNIPYMALKGDYTATSAVCQETVDAINARRASRQGTAKAEYLKLDDMGILGVTHMMMLDKKNLEIADIMLNWVNKNVKKK